MRDYKTTYCTSIRSEQLPLPDIIFTVPNFQEMVMQYVFSNRITKQTALRDCNASNIFYGDDKKKRNHFVNGINDLSPLSRHFSSILLRMNVSNTTHF